MNATEQQAEWDHVRDTRLAILCGTNVATPEQVKLAEGEADEALRILTNGEFVPI